MTDFFVKKDRELKPILLCGQSLLHGAKRIEIMVNKDRGLQGMKPYDGGKRFIVGGTRIFNVYQSLDGLLIFLKEEGKNEWYSISLQEILTLILEQD